MQDNFIPDDMMFLSKLEYQALLDENTFLRLALQNKNNFEEKQYRESYDAIKAQILKLPKDDKNYTYIIQINCEHMLRQSVREMLISLRQLLHDSGARVDNFIFVPTKNGAGKITISKLCTSCSLKPDKYSWYDILKSLVNEVSGEATIYVPEATTQYVASDEASAYQQTIVFNNINIRRKLEEKRKNI